MRVVMDIYAYLGDDDGFRTSLSNISKTMQIDHPNATLQTTLTVRGWLSLQADDRCSTTERHYSIHHEPTGESRLGHHRFILVALSAPAFPRKRQSSRLIQSRIHPADSVHVPMPPWVKNLEGVRLLLRSFACYFQSVQMRVYHVCFTRTQSSSSRSSSFTPRSSLGIGRDLTDQKVSQQSNLVHR